MKKFLLMALVVFVFTVGLVLDSFAEKKPQYGGILKRINPSGARVLGYYPEMGPMDSTEAFPAIERVMEMTEQRTFESFLADSVDIDRNKLTMTFNLKKGIKFHDGSDFNAESCAWNYQFLKDLNKIHDKWAKEEPCSYNLFTKILKSTEYVSSK